MTILGNYRGSFVGNYYKDNTEIATYLMLSDVFLFADIENSMSSVISGVQFGSSLSSFNEK